ncbi:MAG: NarK/NasA family nitrate transporter [Deltaproteobacteria bacterium]|nr:NarK/NasA family nitrate transporter [Deltaproteobacteria bacterium]
MNLKAFMKSGHPPTLFCAFLYFDFCFAIWVMNGAMAPFISEQFHLTPMEKGFMLSVPVLAGAFMRFPTGLLAQYITRKWAAMFEMGLITIGLLYGYFFVDSYAEVIYMGIPLGIAGASFGVALSLGGGWFPPKYKGLAIGIAGAGNSGAVIAMLFAPPLAVKYGWSSVYGYAIILMLIPMALMLFLAKEPPDLERKKLSDYLKILVEKDAWVFNIIYIVSFGGYIGFTMFLPTFFHDQFGIPKSQMGQYAAVIAIMASVLRIAGGWAADRWGGIRMLNTLLILIAVGAFAASLLPSVLITTAILILIFSALGAANGSTFQLVPLRFAYATPIAMSLVGEVGALGGGLLPNAMGISKQYLGSFSGGFIFFGAMSIVALIVLRVVQRRWTTSWVGEGGKALHHEEKAYEA